MNKSSFILSLLLMFFIGQASAQSFTAIAPRMAYEGENFKVTYRVTNGEGSSFQAPQINGCQLVYGPATSTSYSMSSVNGRTTTQSTVDYSYTYTTSKAGTYTIPAASIIIDGKKYTTQPTQFKVEKARQNAGQAPGRGHQPQQPQLPPSSSHQMAKDDMFVRVITNKNSAYEQEAIECTIKLYTRYANIIAFTQTSPPKYDGFLIEELNVEPRLNNEETVNGKVYQTAVLKKAILFPQKSGELVVSTGTYDLVLQSYQTINTGFAIYTTPGEQFHTDLKEYKQTIKVTPLPDPKPSGFNGAVGNFTYDSSLSSESLRTGEAATLTLTVNGTGNIKYLKEPKVEFPSDFEQYTPNQNFDTRVSGATVSGTMTAEYTFVPAETGKYSLTTPEFVYFNPATKQYVTLEAKSYDIDVAKGVGVSKVNDQQDIKVKNKDILHIKLGDKGQSKHVSYLADKIGYWLCYPLMLLALVALMIIMRRRNKIYSDVTSRKIAQANKVARKRLSIAAKEMKAGSRDGFYDAILKALWGYLSDKMAIPASALSRDNVKEELDKLGVNEEQYTRIVELLDECEMARYTPESQLKPMQEIYDNTASIMRELEPFKKSK